MWSNTALAALAYHAVDVTAGFAARALNRSDAIYGRAAALPQQGGSLFFWFELFGINRGDVVGVQFVLPDGTRRPVAESKIDVPVSYIYRSAGLNPEVELRAGKYSAVLTLKRNGETILERSFDIDVK